MRPEIGSLPTESGDLAALLMYYMFYLFDRCECQIVLNNNGKLPVEHINLSLDSKVDKCKYCTCKLILVNLVPAINLIVLIF